MPVKQQYRTLALTKRDPLIAREQRSTLQWLAPTLARVGLVRNESWVEENATLAERYYSALRPQAVALASCHPLALQYLQQAPILILAHMHGGRSDDTFQVSKLIGTAYHFQELVSQRPKLRVLMETFEIPYVLRDLSCPHIDYEDAYLVQRLYHGIQRGHIRASTVKQSFETRGMHTAWLAATRDFATTLDGHLPEYAFSCLNWHLKSWGQPGYDVPSFTKHVADFIVSNPRLFNPAWSVKRMLVEARNWLNQLLIAESTPCEELPPKDYSPWPNEPTKIGEYMFMPLRSSSALGMEGRLMHHCVASYARRVYAGQCRIYSIRHHEPYALPLATVEFRLSGKVNQVRGANNADPPPEILASIEAFQQVCREASDACAV